MRITSKQTKYKEINRRNNMQKMYNNRRVQKKQTNKQKQANEQPQKAIIITILIINWYFTELNSCKPSRFGKKPSHYVCKHGQRTPEPTVKKFFLNKNNTELLVTGYVLTVTATRSRPTTHVLVES